MRGRSCAASGSTINDDNAIPSSSVDFIKMGTSILNSGNSAAHKINRILQYEFRLKLQERPHRQPQFCKYVNQFQFGVRVMVAQAAPSTSKIQIIPSVSRYASRQLWAAPSIQVLPPETTVSDCCTSMPGCQSIHAPARMRQKYPRGDSAFKSWQFSTTPSSIQPSSGLPTA